VALRFGAWLVAARLAGIIAAWARASRPCRTHPGLGDPAVPLGDIITPCPRQPTLAK
jgi:hypothetical protein